MSPLQHHILLFYTISICIGGENTSYTTSTTRIDITRIDPISSNMYTSYPPSHKSKSIWLQMMEYKVNEWNLMFLIICSLLLLYTFCCVFGYFCCQHLSRRRMYKKQIKQNEEKYCMDIGQDDNEKDVTIAMNTAESNTITSTKSNPDPNNDIFEENKDRETIHTNNNLGIGSPKHYDHFYNNTNQNSNISQQMTEEIATVQHNKSPDANTHNQIQLAIMGISINEQRSSQNSGSTAMSSDDTENDEKSNLIIMRRKDDDKSNVNNAYRTMTNEEKEEKEEYETDTTSSSDDSTDFNDDTDTDTTSSSNEGTSNEDTTTSTDDDSEEEESKDGQRHDTTTTDFVGNFGIPIFENEANHENKKNIIQQKNFNEDEEDENDALSPLKIIKPRKQIKKHHVADNSDAFESMHDFCDVDS